MRDFVGGLTVLFEDQYAVGDFVTINSHTGLVERLTALLCGVGPIRDVMAFPKTQKGHCLMSECPSQVDPEQLTELGVAVTRPAGQ